MDSKRSGKKRLDLLLAGRGITESREKAQALILAGKVLVDGRKVEKPGSSVTEDAEIRILGESHPYVSRGGVKLEAAFKAFEVSVSGKTALDTGASTGGFTDCLLRHGAYKVYAVDVGYGQLAWKLRQDPRVVVIERVNIRTMDPALLPEQVDIAVIDVSFISLEKVLPVVNVFLKPQACVIALIKPQFEVGREQVGKGGIVRDEAARAAAVRRISDCMTRLGLVVKGIIPSPITGQDGNVEYLIYGIKH